MEIIKSEKDIFEKVKVGVEIIDKYKSLDGNIYNTLRECEEADYRYSKDIKIKELKNRLKYQEIYTPIMQFELIFIEKIKDLKEYHRLLYSGAYEYTKFKDDITNCWIVVDFSDGGDFSDSVYYYKLEDFKDEIEILNNLRLR